jgi:hypothetical protein
VLTYIFSSVVTNSVSSIELKLSSSSVPLPCYPDYRTELLLPDGALTASIRKIQTNDGALVAGWYNPIVTLGDITMQAD